jgi:hypothetical protein
VDRDNIKPLSLALYTTIVTMRLYAHNSSVIWVWRGRLGLHFVCIRFGGITDCFGGITDCLHVT